MTKTEKSITVIMLLLVTMVFVLTKAILHEIDQVGGVKGVAVEVGKAVKDIKQEVEKYEPEE